MSISKKSAFAEGMTQANITPLADVTTTLIVVFLITMPTIMWNGIGVNQAEAGSEQSVVQPQTQTEDDLTTIEVDPEGLRLNGEPIEVTALEGALTERLGSMEERTVVIVPHDAVELGAVVEVLDISKASGATGLALLNETRNE